MPATAPPATEDGPHKTVAAREHKAADGCIVSTGGTIATPDVVGDDRLRQCNCNTTRRARQVQIANEIARVFYNE